MEDERRKEKRKIEEVIPQELLKLPCWVGYQLRRNKDRTDKVPINVLTGRPAKTNDPSTWTDYSTASDLAFQRGYAGVGFVFQPPYVGVDIDHCVKDGAIAPYAVEILSALNSYSEYSPSGTGIHILCKGAIARACKISKIGLEIYTKGRFFTVTGNLLENYPAELNECTDALKNVFSRFVDIAPANDILSLIAKSKDAEMFHRLYSGHWQSDYPSQSEADLALCNKLAFWTGKDAGQMDALFRQSGLMRTKWDEKHFGDGRTYGQSVIEKAVNGCREVYAPSRANLFIARKVNANEVADEIIKHHRMINFADTYYEYKGGCYRPLFVEEVQKWIKDACGTGFSASKLRNVLVALKTETFVKPDIINGITLFNVKNGLYDIDKMRLLPHSPDVYSINQLNVTYRENAECLLWQKSLDQIFESDVARIMLLQEYFGYCLTRDNDYEKALFLFGEGANGKSVVLYVLEELIGKDNCSSIPLEKFNDSHYIARLRDKLVNISLETNAKTNVYDNMFKAIVTGDTISADEKYGQPFQFKPYCKLLFSTNNMPRVGDKTEGYYRRLLILPFNRQFSIEERDPKLKHKIVASELDGIFLWSLNGLTRLRKRGYFEESVSMQTVKDAYRKENNNVIIFVEEQCVLDAQADVGSDALYVAYRDWCLESEYRPLSKILFGRELLRQYSAINKGRCGASRRWDGIRIRKEGEVDYSERPF
jgi:putative DNA primase/helicase